MVRMRKSKGMHPICFKMIKSRLCTKTTFQTGHKRLPLLPKFLTFQSRIIQLLSTGDSVKWMKTVPGVSKR